MYYNVNALQHPKHMTDILEERSEDGIATLILNRPDALNAFTFAMYESLIERLETLRHDSSVRVVTAGKFAEGM